MKERVFTIARMRPLRALAVTLIVLLALAMGAQAAPAGGTPGVNYELGNNCVEDYTPGAVCTANDVVISNISPSIEEACLAAGDTATVKFTLQLLTNATTRYDIGMFVATDGGSAKSGNMCYHDFLQPASTTGPWNLTSGFGAFKEFDPDTCADTLQNDGSVYYTLQQLLTIQCVDTNNDGVVDPISTCTSWDNQSSAGCNNVKGAFPSTKSKCRCEDQATGVQIYRGYDWGDLPDSYKTYKASGGPQHAVQDLNNDGAPDTLGAVPAVWLGSKVDYSPKAETDGQPNGNATGDDNNYTQDEDGVSPLSPWYYGTDGGKLSVKVSSSNGTCTGCKLGFWIDWNLDGNFDDAGESYIKPVIFGNQTVSFDITQPMPIDIYARFRLYAGEYNGAYVSGGLVVNGEVEDYNFARPTAVKLLWFKARGYAGLVKVGWETASEIDNLGFNLYRSEQAKGPKTKLNSSLIPSQVPPGSPFGAVYGYKDRNVQPGKIYFYWLEDVDIYGRTGLHGPVKASMP